MNVITLIIREYWPIGVAFVLGIILGTRSCGEPELETITIEKPVAQIEYVDRWKKDTVRFVSKDISFRFDTITSTKIVTLLDTLIIVDTVSIVDTWLTEKLNYDTIARFKDSEVRLSWSNYQNQSEELKISLSSPAERMRVGVFARGGVMTDFKGLNNPVIGGGVMLFNKRFIFGVEYGYSTDHQIIGLLGYQL
tara:strand:+ start:908 stop:1489 length:582 start_codon:yes stop_codon:yes gene_type:complete